MINLDCSAQQIMSKGGRKASVSGSSLHSPTHSLFFLFPLVKHAGVQWMNFSVCNFIAVSWSNYGPFSFWLAGFHLFTKSTYGHSYRDSRASLRYFLLLSFSSSLRAQLDSGAGPARCVKICIPVSPMNNFRLSIHDSSLTICVFKF